MNFTPITPSHKALLEEWLKDPEFKARLSGIEPVDKFVDYVISSPERSMWIVYEDEETMGHFDVEFNEDGSIWADVSVAPERRGQGIGSQILSEGLALPELKKVKVVKITIRPDNETSIRLFEGAGFVKEGDGVDEEGFLHYFLNR